jgi:hypothetical protein
MMMDIEDSSESYRAFRRSGSYPALTQRVLRSGSVLAQAAGWFALIVTAASVGYTLTQRLVTPSAASPREFFVRSAAKPTPPSSMHQELPSRAAKLVEDQIVSKVVADDEHGAKTSERSPGHKAAPARKRAGAVVQVARPAAAEPVMGAAHQAMEPERAAQIAERVRALDDATHVAASEPVRAQAAPDPIPEPTMAEDRLQDEGHARVARQLPVKLLRPSDERPHAAVQAPTPRVAVGARTSVAPAQPAEHPLAAAPNQPLRAAARVDGVTVRGPLSAAQLRRSIDRIRPSLSECYADAARRTGQNRFSQVRVVVSIDEAGRVKTLPTVEGAQLPGFGDCLRNVMSKLVCQTPDTGTAKASIMLGFSPAVR